MAARAKCAIVGGGVMGAAAAFALAGRGADVALYDQFEFFHAKGSSHGATRLFRTAYFEHADYVPLLRRAAAAWRALEAGGGETLLEWTGLFLAGPPAGPLISGTRRAARDHALALQSLTNDAARKRFPQFTLPAAFERLFEADAGVIFADRAHRAFLKGARAQGAKLFPNQEILGWSASPRGVALEIGDERRTFDRLVLTPGAWAQNLLGDIGVDIRPVRKTLFWAAPGENACRMDSGFPPFAMEQSDARFFYGFPAIDGDGVKLGEHTGGEVLPAPESAAETPDAGESIIEFLRAFAPGLPRAISKTQACLYAMSPDGHFIIDRHPREPRVAFAAGFSGHGFKFAPVIGAALADLALDGEPSREFDFLKLGRFE